MTIIFYPHEDQLTPSTAIQQKLETLLDAAERYKVLILDGVATSAGGGGGVKIRSIPREMTAAFNWDEIAKLLRQIRELPEATPINKSVKAERLQKLAEIYEILRAAKMPKLEAVRLALVNEANQLRSAAG